MIGEHLTKGSDPRWQWLSTITSLVILLSLPLFVGLVMLGTMTLAPLTQGWFILYGTVVLASAVYVFGRETLEVVYRFKNGGFTDK